MQTLVSDGVTLAFRDIPAEGVDLGEPILLIHGFASSTPHQLGRSALGGDADQSRAARHPVRQSRPRA